MIKNQLQKLDQNDYKSKIIEDTFFEQKKSIGNGNRTAIFQCMECGNEYENVCSSEKTKKISQCQKCYIKKRYPEFHRKQEAYHAYKTMDETIGIYKIKDKWRAVGYEHGDEHYIGSFNTREGAMWAYDEWIRKHKSHKETNLSKYIKNIKQ